jgi:hypothetical protein
MVQIDRAYLALALALLIVGEGLGLYMGIANDMRLRNVHITLMLPGFVTLAIYGFIFRLWPAMKIGPLAAAQFWLGAISTIGIMIGAYQFVVSGSIAIVAPSSVLAIVATLILGWLFLQRTSEVSS